MSCTVTVKSGVFVVDDGVWSGPEPMRSMIADCAEGFDRSFKYIADMDEALAHYIATALHGTYKLDYDPDERYDPDTVY